MSRSVVVVGGGITGAFVAYFLVRQGCAVTVVDPGGPACRATDNNPGGINPLHGPGIPGDMTELALQSHRLHRREWDEICRLSGIEFARRNASRIMVAFSDADAGRLEATARLYEGTEGFAAQWLDAAALKRLEPGINGKACGGLLTSGNATVDAAAYARAVLAAACAMGCRARADRFAGVAGGGGRITRVLVGGESLDCDAVVFATGAWVSEIEASLNIRIPVRPVRGELLLVEARAGVAKHDVTWNEVGVYRHNERWTWIGGTWDEAGYDGVPTDAGKQRILEGADDLLPGIANAAVVRHTAGLRPVTPDGKPILGQVPGCENAFLALGGGSKGILLSSGLGRTAAALAAGDTSVSVPACLALERFGVIASPGAGDDATRARVAS